MGPASACYRKAPSSIGGAPGIGGTAVTLPNPYRGGGPGPPQQPHVWHRWGQRQDGGGAAGCAAAPRRGDRQGAANPLLAHRHPGTRGAASPAAPCEVLGRSLVTPNPPAVPFPACRAGLDPQCCPNAGCSAGQRFGGPCAPRCSSRGGAHRETPDGGVGVPRGGGTRTGNADTAQGAQPPKCHPCPLSATAVTSLHSLTHRPPPGCAQDPQRPTHRKRRPIH